MTCTRIFLGILSLTVLATPALAAQTAPNCEEWNTREFFETATVEDVTACLDAAADPMAGSSSVEAGELGSGDTIRSNGAYEDGYSYVGRAGQEVVVEVRSSDFDTYLIVESPSGERFVNDDYQGDTGRSLLSLSLDETGEYRLLVSSYSSGERGLYTLRIGQGDTPLHWAAFGNPNPVVIEALLAAGAEVDARTNGGFTPLHRAALNNENPAVIEALLTGGANLEARDEDGNTPLHWAARNNGNPVVLEALLAAGANLGARDDSDNTPLHWAAVGSDRGEYYDPANLEALIAAGADLEARNQDGNTPLHYAVGFNEDPAVIETLLVAGADPMVRNAYGRTPLHLAAVSTWSLAVIEALLVAGADPMVRDADGRTSLHWAAWTNYNPAVIQALLAAGADLEARDSNGNTPLHLAASYSYRGNKDAASAIEALLDAGADAVARNAAGETPWDLAEANEPLQGTDGYWRLNDARFEPPGPDARRAPPSREGAEAASSGADSAEGGIGGQPPDGGTSAPGVAATGTPGFPARGGSCQIPGFPNPGDMTNLGLAWCPASETFQVRAFALQAEGMRCAVAANPSEATPEVVSRVRSQISEVCARLEALGERLGGPGDCRCPAGFGP